MNCKRSLFTAALSITLLSNTLRAEEERPRPEPERKPEARREEPGRAPEEEKPRGEGRKQPAPHPEAEPRREESRTQKGHQPSRSAERKPGTRPGPEGRDRPEEHNRESEHAARPEGAPVEERLRHLMEASEHLALAGFPEESRHVREQAELLKRETEMKARHEASPFRPGPEHAERAHREMLELRQHVEELHREVARLREEMNRGRGRAE